MSAPDVASIRREFLGGAEETTLIGFANTVIQDEDTALDIAKRLLDDPSEAYLYNEDQPLYIERFTVLDEEALREQVRLVEEEGWS